MLGEANPVNEFQYLERLVYTVVHGGYPGFKKTYYYEVCKIE